MFRRLPSSHPHGMRVRNEYAFLAGNMGLNATLASATVNIPTWDFQGVYPCNSPGIQILRVTPITAKEKTGDSPRAY